MYRAELLSSSHQGHTREGDGRHLATDLLRLLRIGLILWFAYGMLAHSVPVMVANAVTLVPAVIILAMKIKLG